ncbi:unnamed protein product [Diatraea saccharalis]|uniref:MADF domain-containing protein n=1 Tax=Diatraea saccharalis TaxID=40085 RepID=A0A9N9RAB1_9NEOP|nr:unnamed protein product [Diatraea saccharalis]
MATFRQHLKKKKNSVTSGCGEEDIYKPIWVFYNTMESFLGDVYECSSKLNTIIQANASSSTDEQYDAIQAVSEQGQRSSSSNVTMHEDSIPPSNRTTLKRRSSNPPELQKATNQMQDALITINTVLANKSAQKEDMCDIYGKLIASKLKKYFSDIEQQEVMFELDELLTKRIRNSLKQRPTSSLSAMNSTDSFDSTSPAEIHRPSSSQTFYVLPDSPVQIPQRPFSSQSYSILHVPEQNNMFNQSMTLCSPQHEQLQQPTDEQNNQVQILSDEVVDSVRLKPILQEAFFKAMISEQGS